MPVTVPAWFKGRQGKTEEVRPDLLRVNAPNLKEWFVGLQRQGDGSWLASVQPSAEGPAEVTQALERDLVEYEAWEAAFEVYRTHVII